MEPQLSQDSLESPHRQVEASEPSTPELSHATIPDSTLASVSSMQASRVENATIHMTPPPSSQVPTSSQRGKTRTPTPPVSHISTPPPTVETLALSQPPAFARLYSDTLESDRLADATADELRSTISELMGALREAKMSAAHHKLQYQMLAQESAAAIERMAVEARMTQYENEVLHSAEQAKVAATTPVQASPLPEGTIPVQKDLYQRMCHQIRHLSEDCDFWKQESAQMDAVGEEKDYQIARLSDRIELLRERIRESREQSRSKRRSSFANVDSTPRSSAYLSPLRHGVASHEQPQPFAALLQASEMASQEARRRPSGQGVGKKGHVRNTHSLSSLPVTPSRGLQQSRPYHTPQNRQPPLKIPATAPIPRTTTAGTSNIYTHPSLPVSQPGNTTRPRAASSESTVSASPSPTHRHLSHLKRNHPTTSAPEDDAANESEAETEILASEAQLAEDQPQIPESRASWAASQILRADSIEQQRKRESFQGSGLLANANERFRQTRLFGKVSKPGLVRSLGGEEGEGSAKKRARTGEMVAAAAPVVGLGIAGVEE